MNRLVASLVFVFAVGIMNETASSQVALTISPNPVSTDHPQVAGVTESFKVTATDAAGKRVTVPASSIVWHTSEDAKPEKDRVAKFSAEIPGLLELLSPGDLVVWATGDFSGLPLSTPQVYVHVIAAAVQQVPGAATLQSFSIPNLAPLPFNGSLTVQAWGYYVDGEVRTSAPLKSGITWKTDPESSPYFSIAADTGVVKPLAPGGTASIVATYTGPANVAIKTQKALLTIVVVASGVPSFAEAPQAGNNYVKVRGTQDDIIVVHRLAEGDVRADGAPCSPRDLSDGQVVPLVVGNAAADEGKIVGIGKINTLMLGAPLSAGAQLCLEETSASAGSVAQLSPLRTVGDPNDFGRVRTYLTLGLQITNQLPAAGSGAGAQSSTAGEYLETGLVYSLFRAGSKNYDIPPSRHWHPGLQSVFDVRLSPIPVSAPVAGAPASPPFPPTISSLNLLSSQQSARVVGQLFMPLRVGGWGNGYNVYTLAPLVKAGFSTLLNPTTIAATASGLANVTQFSSTYSMFGFGGRMAWDRYPRSTDKAPQMITQLDVALTKYSNLPSYVCSADSTKLDPLTGTSMTMGTSPVTTTTYKANFASSCATVGPSGTATTHLYDSRKLVYRLDIEGIAKLPGYPFVLGVTANLAQYGIAPKTIDYLNKPGNDIRIFIGLTVPLNSLGSLLTTGTIPK